MTSGIVSFGGQGGAALDEGDTDAPSAQRLGEKGAGLIRMAAMGLPVPPGFIIPAGAAAGPDGQLPASLVADIRQALTRLADTTGRRFADPQRPLFLSIRASPPAPAPGVMDTVLNLGFSPATAAAFATETGNRALAHDARRRFLQSFATIVLGRDPRLFEECLEAADENGAADPERLAAAFAAIVANTDDDSAGMPFPTDPEPQLLVAIAAALRSWHSPRAVAHRVLQEEDDGLGLAVIVQAMVFGTAESPSGTGVAFTRNPITGAPGLTGEFVVGGQGDDVLAGIGDRRPLAPRDPTEPGENRPSFAALAPEAFDDLCSYAERIERSLADVAEIAFTVERGRVHLLQARPAKRSPAAGLRIAIALADAGVIEPAEAVLRADPNALDLMLHPTIAPGSARDRVGTGLSASPGAASGEIALDAATAAAAHAAGRKVILVLAETTPEDVHGMHAAEGILTLRGGLTSHAAVVARGLGKPCITGAAGMRIDPQRRALVAGQRVFTEGEIITVDGSTGDVLAGAVAMTRPELSGDFARLMEWADRFRRMRVRANADTAAEARTAFSFGAEGIGLCRTEHMFFDERWIVPVRELILAEDAAGRRTALAKLLPPQRRDIAELFRIAAGRPVTVRLLDPPLHEFMPRTTAEMAEMAEAMGIPAERIRQRAAALTEVNPMLGLRGCRLALTFPEIIDMQTRAILEAAIEVGAEGLAVQPEIMVPLVASRAEMMLVRARIDAGAEAMAAEHGSRPSYRVGTMIELPRAALRAAAIAENAEFFSFGTNDLTQTTYGISRDDAASFLGAYAASGIFRSDPFASIDPEGVGELMQIAVERGRSARPMLTVGICGEHGGEPASIGFCERLGLDYVSCSPYRVPVARLAAAQAALRQGRGSPEK